jgi:TcpE family
VADRPSQVRSYQRIFRPDRRIYQIDGRPLPIPGGIPLPWLAWVTGTVVTVLLLSSRSLTLALLLATIAAIAAAGEGGWKAAALASTVTFTGALAFGVVLSVLDWPLRLVILPIAVATLAGQVTPDGRPAHRYLLSWLSVKFLRPERQSLDRPVPADGRVELWGPWTWIAADEHTPTLGRGRVRGPARLEFTDPVVVIDARGRWRRRFVVTPAAGRRPRRGDQIADAIDLGTGRTVEIRP